MPKLPKSGFDVSKITGKWQLLGAFLLVIEALLGYWMYLAESPSERIFSGILMTVIALTFLVIVLLITKATEGDRLAPGGVGEVTPGHKEATQVEIDAPEDERIGSPGGSYSILKPPPDWTCKAVTLTDWVGASLQVTDPAARKQMAGSDSDVKEILCLRSKREVSIIPIPGQSLIDGRPFPTALEFKVPNGLDIVPIDRTQPPLYVERPFDQNVLSAVCKILGLGVMALHKLESGTLGNTARRYMMAEFRQVIEPALVNDRQVESISNYITVIGIEGELRDHLLYMKYTSQPRNLDPDLERDLKTLNSLVSSFRPLKVFDADERKAEFRKKADENFAKLIAEKGQNMLYAEMSVVLQRLRDKDLTDPDNRREALRLLAPFEQFAAVLKLKEDNLATLWEAIHLAEDGDAKPFIERMGILMTAFLDRLAPDDSKAAPAAIDAPDSGSSE